MTLFCLFSFFILWLNMNESLQQDGIKCTAPLIEHGVVLGGIQEYKENQVLNYQCDPQYKRVEERQSKCIIVGARAEWSPTPACESINCEVKLPALEGTRYEPASRNVFLPGDTLRVFCGEKHWIVDHQTTTTETTCQSDGKWSIRPLCQEVICSNRRDPSVSGWNDDPSEQKKLGDSVYYRCRAGYRSASSNNYATCTRDGWAPKPLCQGTPCAKPNIENADLINIKDQYSHREQVQYTCRNANRNTLTAVCIHGDWTGKKSCSEYCHKLNNEKQSMNFTSDKDKYMNGDVIKYQCIIPDPVAEGNATCMDGKWIKTVECKDVTCKVGVLHPGLTVTVQVGEKLQFDCSSEFELDGSKEIECLPTGQWSSPIPTCL